MAKGLPKPAPQIWGLAKSPHQEYVLHMDKFKNSSTEDREGYYLDGEVINLIFDALDNLVNPIPEKTLDVGAVTNKSFSWNSKGR